MGSIFGFQYKLSNNSWTYLQSNEINIGLIAEFDAAKNFTNATINWNQTEYEMFQSSYQEKQIFS